MIPIPSQNEATVRRLGIPHDEVTIAPNYADDHAYPIKMMHGLLPTPFVGRCYLPGPTDNETTASEAAKQFGVATYGPAIVNLRQYNETQIAHSRDKRFSYQGRIDAQNDVFREWVGRRFVRVFASAVDSQYGALYDDLMLICQPRPLGAANAAAAVLDSEYRGIIRAMPNDAKKIAHIYDMTLNEPDSPILSAVLRADAAASGIPKKVHANLLMRNGMVERPKQIMSIWGAAAMLDVCAYLITWGTQRLAVAAAAQGGTEQRRIESGINGSESRRKLAEAIEAIISAASTVKVDQGKPDENAEA